MVLIRNNWFEQPSHQFNLILRVFSVCTKGVARTHLLYYWHSHLSLKKRLGLTSFLLPFCRSTGHPSRFPFPIVGVYTDNESLPSSLLPTHWGIVYLSHASYFLWQEYTRTTAPLPICHTKLRAKLSWAYFLCRIDRTFTACITTDLLRPHGWKPHGL